MSQTQIKLAIQEPYVGTFIDQNQFLVALVQKAFSNQVFNRLLHQGGRVFVHVIFNLIFLLEMT